MKKKLYRSRSQRILAGVCGGIAEYFKVNPKYIRIGYLVFTLICSLFIHTMILPILIYLILAFAIPNNPNQNDNNWKSMYEKYTGRTFTKSTSNRKIIHDVKEKDIKK